MYVCIGFWIVSTCIVILCQQQLRLYFQRPRLVCLLVGLLVCWFVSGAILIMCGWILMGLIEL